VGRYLQDRDSATVAKENGNRDSVGVKRALVILLFCVAVLGGLFLYARSTSVPPKEAKLIHNFYAHRAAFERLRDMLLADGQVIRLAGWGVATTNSVVPRVPPEGNFPLDRYKEYMALLKQVGGFAATRGEGQHPDPSIVVWAWGFAGNTRHAGICWMDQEPTNQVATLDGYPGRSRYGDRQVVFRHIDTSWYLWMDL
jgi:hypothetical protein